MNNNVNKMLSEEDRKRLRARFAQLQEERAEEENKRVGKLEEVVKEAMQRVNNGEALEDVFEYCYDAGVQASRG